MAFEPNMRPDPHYVLENLLDQLREAMKDIPEDLGPGVDFRFPSGASAVFPIGPIATMRMSLELLGIPGDVVAGSQQHTTKANGLDDAFVFAVLTAIKELQNAGASNETILEMLKRH